MPKVEKGELRVPAIKNGSVIDHIPVEDLFRVVQLLKLYELEYPISIGQNFKSEKMGRKGIIKVEEKYFTPDEVNKLSLISTDVVISVIKDYEVVEKIHVELPQRIRGLVHCPNPKCITNNEPMLSDFKVIPHDNEQVLKCEYCTREVKRKEIILNQDVK